MSEKKNKSLRRQEDVRLLDEEVFEEFEDEEDFSESDNFSADDSFEKRKKRKCSEEGEKDVGRKR